MLGWLARFSRPSQRRKRGSHVYWLALEELENRLAPAALGPAPDWTGWDPGMASVPALPSSTSTTAAPIHFAVIGDFGIGSQGEADVAALVKSWNPEFIITVGDNNYPYGFTSTIDQNIGKYYHDYIAPYVGSFGAGSDINRFFPSLGNHDWGNKYPNPTGAQPYLNYFTLPGKERYYDFAWGPVHFFVVDSDKNEPDGNTSNSIQAQWLHDGLAAASEPWKLVYFHHPPFSSVGSNPPLQWPFRAWGASAVLTGHAHVYERIIKDGLPYITNGLGGSEIGAFNKTVAGSQVRYNGDFGAMLVDAASDQITFQFYSRTHVLIDTFTIDAIPFAPSNLAAKVLSTSSIQLTWTDQSTNETGFRIEASTDGVNFAQVGSVVRNVSTWTATGLTGQTTYYFQVRAFSDAGDSGPSVVQSRTAVPPSPTNLSAAAISSTQIDLTWQDNAINENGFRILRSTDGVLFTQIAHINKNLTTYQSKGLSPGTLYYFRIRAYNGVGNSGFSNIASAATNAASALALQVINAHPVNPSSEDFSNTLETGWGFVIMAQAQGELQGSLFNAYLDIYQGLRRRAAHFRGPFDSPNSQFPIA